MKKITLKFLVTIAIFSVVFSPILVHKAFAYPTQAQIDEALRSRGYSTNPADGDYGFHLNQVLTELGPQSGPLTTVSAFLNRISAILNIFIPFLVGLAVFLIIYGILRYVANAADEEKRKEAKDFISWGIVAVFIMLSIWGLVNILTNSLPTDNSRAAVNRIYQTGTIPNLPTNDPTLIDFIQRMNAIGPYLIGFFFTIAFFIIFVGILNYIKDGANEEKRAEARKFIIWGIVSLFIMLSVWGFVNILLNSLQLDTTFPSNKIPQLPKLPTN